MDPVTHTITGLLVSNSIISPSESIVPAVGAIFCSNLPDLDFFTKLLPENTVFMRLHHGLSHSIFIGLLMTTIVSSTLYFATGFSSFPLLFLICFLASCTHLFLDSLIHNMGIQLFAPFSSKYFSIPILLGLNPLSTSAKCYMKSIFVCLKCQMNTAIKSPTVIILACGFLFSLILFPYIRIVSILTLLVCLTYHSYLYMKRKMAIKIFLGGKVRDEIEKYGVYSASFSPFLWLGVVLFSDKSIVVEKIDVKEEKIREHKAYSPPEITPVIESSKKLKVVDDFLKKCVFPYVTSYSENGERIIKWKDLGYDFSDTIDLYTLLLKYDSSNNLVFQAFRERW
jgi:membrane-bound metal-dependent hydrolase YbcI (DUF457 family)